MIVLDCKARVKPVQATAINEAIRTAQFVRNKCLRFWMDNKGMNKYDLNKHCKILAREFEWAGKLNSQARQSSSEQSWSSISRFYANCKQGVRPVGFPKFRKHSRSVFGSYITGWSYSEVSSHIVSINSSDTKVTSNLSKTPKDSHHSPAWRERDRRLGDGVSLRGSKQQCP